MLAAAEAADDESRKIFHNTTLSFSKRLYGTLSLRLERYALKRPVNHMLKWDDMYKNEKLPASAVESLVTLTKVGKEMA